MITALMMKNMFDSFDEAGMDLSIMEIKVMSPAKGAVHPLTGAADIEVSEDGTYGEFRFVYIP